MFVCCCKHVCVFLHACVCVCELHTWKYWKRISDPVEVELQLVLCHLTGVLKTEIVSFTREVCVLIYGAISPSQLNPFITSNQVTFISQRWLFIICYSVFFIWLRCWKVSTLYKFIFSVHLECCSVVTFITSISFNMFVSENIYTW